jgi:sugar O-acyltransferase (sialic acid O-acetyltransferase NeuD family)
MVLLSESKVKLHNILQLIKDYCQKVLLYIKKTYQIFPTDIRGIDFLGYRFFHDFILLRKSIANNFKKKIKLIKELGLTTDKFINLIHDGLDISKMSTIGAGVLINSKVSIAAHTKIGNFASINRHVSIGHHTTISDYCSINPGTNIAGNVTIGEGTTIGMGVNIIDGIKIGKNTIIGAGSVVTKDIPDNVVAYGSPCKIIRDNG